MLLPNCLKRVSVPITSTRTHVTAWPSAVVGFMRTFGMDEPMGCYDDIEHADAFVLWGANMAEMHPILWSRITNRRLSDPNVNVAVPSTFQHRSFELADNGMVFTPQTDLGSSTTSRTTSFKTMRLTRFL